jgi:hypothetical protein
MTLDANEFIRRFLIHVLPDGFHRIRRYPRFSAVFKTSKFRSPSPSPSGDKGSPGMSPSSARMRSFGLVKSRAHYFPARDRGAAGA